MTLRELRKRAGLTQAEVAKVMGASHVQVGQWERQRVDYLRLDLVKRYVAALDPSGKADFVVSFDDDDAEVLT